MTDSLSPNRTITIAGKKYVLDGSFGTLRAVQEFFKKDIVQVLIGIMEMPFHSVADLIAIGSGHPENADAIGQAILDEVGTMTSGYVLLKTELTAWLNVAMAPQKDREKKSEQMRTIIEKMSASRGESTANSVSDASTGRPETSGMPTSGT